VLRRARPTSDFTAIEIDLHPKIPSLLLAARPARWSFDPVFCLVITETAAASLASCTEPNCRREAGTGILRHRKRDQGDGDSGLSHRSTGFPAAEPTSSSGANRAEGRP
jgi:hypothetical protein